MTAPTPQIALADPWPDDQRETLVSDPPFLFEFTLEFGSSYSYDKVRGKYLTLCQIVQSPPDYAVEDVGELYPIFTNANAYGLWTGYARIPPGAPYPFRVGNIQVFETDLATGAVTAHPVDNTTAQVGSAQTKTNVLAKYGPEPDRPCAPLPNGTDTTWGFEDTSHATDRRVTDYKAGSSREEIWLHPWTGDLWCRLLSNTAASDGAYHLPLRRQDNFAQTISGHFYRGGNFDGYTVEPGGETPFQIVCLTEPFVWMTFATGGTDGPTYRGGVSDRFIDLFPSERTALEVSNDQPISAQYLALQSLNPDGELAYTDADIVYPDREIFLPRPDGTAVILQKYTIDDVGEPLGSRVVFKMLRATPHTSYTVTGTAWPWSYTQSGGGVEDITPDWDDDLKALVGDYLDVGRGTGGRQSPETMRAYKLGSDGDKIVLLLELQPDDNWEGTEDRHFHAIVIDPETGDYTVHEDWLPQWMDGSLAETSEGAATYEAVYLWGTEARLDISSYAYTDNYAVRQFWIKGRKPKDVDDPDRTVSTLIEVTFDPTGIAAPSYTRRVDDSGYAAVYATYSVDEGRPNTASWLMEPPSPNDPNIFEARYDAFFDHRRNKFWYGPCDESDGARFIFDDDENGGLFADRASLNAGTPFSLIGFTAGTIYQPGLTFTATGAFTADPAGLFGFHCRRPTPKTWTRATPDATRWSCATVTPAETDDDTG